MITLGKLNYHEVDEVRAGVLRNWGERRIRMANNVRVRRATHALSEAATSRAVHYYGN